MPVFVAKFNKCAHLKDGLHIIDCFPSNLSLRDLFTLKHAQPKQLDPGAKCPKGGTVSLALYHRGSIQSRHKGDILSVSRMIKP